MGGSRRSLKRELKVLCIAPHSDPRPRPEESQKRIEGMSDLTVLMALMNKEESQKRIEGGEVQQIHQRAEECRGVSKEN